MGDDELEQIAALERLGTFIRRGYGAAATALKPQIRPVHYSGVRGISLGYGDDEEVSVSLTSESTEAYVPELHPDGAKIMEDYYLSQEEGELCQMALSGYDKWQPFLGGFIRGEIQRTITPEDAAPMVSTIDHATAVVAKLRKQPFPHMVRFYLHGVVLDTTNPIEFDLANDGYTAKISIRAATAADLTRFECTAYTHWSGNQRAIPDSILTITAIISGDQEHWVFRQGAERVKLFFLLWRGLGVSYSSPLAWSHDLSNFISWGGHNHSTQIQTPSRKMRLSQPLAMSFERAAISMIARQDALSALHKSAGTSANNFPITIGIRHLEKAVFSGKIEESITDCMIGLEALMVTEHTEVGYRLKLRAAKYLSSMGIDPYTAMKHITTGYNIRSSYSHGTPIRPNIMTAALTDDLRGHLEAYLATMVRRFLMDGVVLSKERDVLIQEIEASFFTTSTEQNTGDQQNNM